MATAGLELARAKRFDLVILDLMLPQLDGVTVCRAIRRDSPNADTPILMLTARREESDKVRRARQRRGRLPDQAVRHPRADGARAGAAAPRTHTKQARAADAASLGPISYKHIELDPARRRVRVGETDVDLTFNEFELLFVLISNPGIVFSREALLSRVWKDQTYVTVRSVDTLVKRLRKKIEHEPGRTDSHPHRLGCRL